MSSVKFRTSEQRDITKLILAISILLVIIAAICCYINNYHYEEEPGFKNKVHDKVATQDDIDYWNKVQADKEAAEEKKRQEEQAAKQVNVGVYPPITKSSGVYEYAGLLHKYYSSNVLAHYRLNEWYTDDRGFWRDSQGYFVVAHGMNTQIGTIIEIAPGVMGKILDHCETNGVVDIYTSW